MQQPLPNQATMPSLDALMRPWPAGAALPDASQLLPCPVCSCPVLHVCLSSCVRALQPAAALSLPPRPHIPLCSASSANSSSYLPLRKQ